METVKSEDSQGEKPPDGDPIAAGSTDGGGPPEKKKRSRAPYRAGMNGKANNSSRRVGKQVNFIHFLLYRGVVCVVFS